MSYNVKNYTEQGGEVTHIGGKLIFDAPLAPNQAASTAETVSALKDDFNALLDKLKNAGVITPNAWNVSVLACPTPAAMPAEQTAANSGHASFAIEGDLITITLDCKVSELAVANHGETWGTHKWLGFGVDTGLSSVVGVVFTDDTGASATLTADDAGEAATLGLSAGDFVLYIKAEQPGFLIGEKYFTLWFNGYALTKFRMKIIEG